MLTEHVTIARRFQRSIRLDTDLARADALQGFVCQRSAADGLLGMAGQIAQTTQRAFTWTGPYGGGKSSLAIVLAGLLGPKGGVRSAAAASLGPETTQQLLKIFKPTPDGWLIIPVVGRRDDPVADIAGAFEQARRRDGAVRGRPRREVQTADALFGLEHFWDYLRINLEPAILASNDSHRWAQDADAIERCEARGSPLHVRLAKSIALIDMFRNGSGLAADRITLGVGTSDAPKHAVDKALGDYILD